MSRKVFVSYKYADRNVRALHGNVFSTTKSVRGRKNIYL